MALIDFRLYLSSGISRKIPTVTAEFHSKQQKSKEIQENVTGV